MPKDLFWLTLTVAMTGLFWLPYILDRIKVRGLMSAMGAMIGRKRLIDSHRNKCARFDGQLRWNVIALLRDRLALLIIRGSARRVLVRCGIADASPPIVRSGRLRLRLRRILRHD